MNRDCSTCRHQPEWSQREDLVEGLLESGDCDATGWNIDLCNGQFISEEGPVTNCLEYEPTTTD